MDFKIRRNRILEILNNSDTAIKGQQIAATLGVTRQIIVKDIAILRAEGKKIIATSEGYIIDKKIINSLTKIIAVNHSIEDTKQELEAIIKYGGRVKDVIIEHSIYGEISANLMLKTYYDIEKFMQKLRSENAEPLSKLTGGLHLHTIEVDEIKAIENIVLELDNLGFLVKDTEI